MVRHAFLWLILLVMCSCVGPDPEGPSLGTKPRGPASGSNPRHAEDESLKIALVYTHNKSQWYLTEQHEFPLSRIIESDEDFLAFVVKSLRQNLTPITAPAIANFSLQLVKKLTINQFGTLYFYNWGETLVSSAGAYKNAMPLTIFDDGANIFLDPSFRTPVTHDAKTSREAIKRFLLNPALVHELHNLGFKIPGEQNLYNTLHAIDPTIDTAQYPDLHI